MASKWIALGELCVRVEDVRAFNSVEYDPNYDGLLSARALRTEERKPVRTVLNVHLVGGDMLTTNDAGGEFFKKLQRALEAV